MTTKKTSTNARLHGAKRKKNGEFYTQLSDIEEELLELVLKWVSGNNVEEYMKIHQHDENAHELWLYFNDVIQWIERTFPVYRKELMRSVAWGTLYRQFKDATLDPNALEAEISALIADDDVDNNRGVYSYVLTRQEKWLNLRTFSQNIQLAAYERQHGICPICRQAFPFEKNGRRPYYTVERGRQNKSRKLPNAKPRA